MLGAFRAQWADGGEIEFAGWSRSAQLFAALLVRPEHRETEAALAELLWPHSPAAASNIGKVVFELRAALAAAAPGVDLDARPAIVRGGGMVSIATPYEPIVDVFALEREASALIAQPPETPIAAETCEGLLELMSGDVLPRATDPVATALRARFRRLRHRVLLLLAAMAGGRVRGRAAAEALFADAPGDDLVAGFLFGAALNDGALETGRMLYERHRAALRAGETPDPQWQRVFDAPRGGIDEHSTPLVRSEATRVVSETIESARRRDRGRLEVIGGPGSGKSRLLVEIGLQAQREGIAVAFARARKPLGSDVVMHDLIRSLTVNLTAEEILRRDFVPAGSIDQFGNSILSLSQLRAAIAGFAARGPTLLVLDDPHVLPDDAGPALLAAIASEDAPVGIVVSRKTDGPELLPGAKHFAIPTLGDVALLEIVRARFEEPVTDRLARELAELWPANLHVLVEAAKHVRTEGIATLVDTPTGPLWMLEGEWETLDFVPSALQLSIERRIAALSRPASEVLRALSFADGCATIALLVDMCGNDPDAIGAGAKELVRSGFATLDGECVRVPPLPLALAARRVSAERARLYAARREGFLRAASA